MSVRDHSKPETYYDPVIRGNRKETRPGDSNTQHTYNLLYEHWHQPDLCISPADSPAPFPAESG